MIASRLSTASQGGFMSTKYKSSPIFGWLTAGSDLLTAQLESVAQTVSDRLDDTHEIMLSMQEKGVQVEKELKQALPTGNLFSSVQGFVSSMPLFSLLSGGKNKAQKEQQLTALSHKVDLLIEQVALLAAKEAAQKSAQASAKKAAVAEKKPRATRAKPASKVSTDSKTATATTPTKVAVEAKADTTKKAPAASSSKAKTTTTRKRRTPAKTASVKTSSTKPASATSTKPASATNKASVASSTSEDSTKTS